jgi:hypothetical protein
LHVDADHDHRGDDDDHGIDDHGDEPGVHVELRRRNDHDELESAGVAASDDDDHVDASADDDGGCGSDDDRGDYDDGTVHAALEAEAEAQAREAEADVHPACEAEAGTGSDAARVHALAPQRDLEYLRPADISSAGRTRSMRRRGRLAC